MNWAVQLGWSSRHRPAERDVLPTAKVNNGAPDPAGPVSPRFNQTEEEVKPDAELPTGRPRNIPWSETMRRDREGKMRNEVREDSDPLDFNGRTAV